VRIAVLDVGSNTVRLLVADRNPGGLEPVAQRRAHLGLGEEVELFGKIRAKRLGVVAAEARAYAREARALGAETIHVLVTAPGRQAENGAELLNALTAATGVPARVLSADEEGRLAFAGALSSLDDPPGTVAVCDVGGGSTEIAIGTPAGGIAWLHSLDLGALRLTHRLAAGDPPGRAALEAMRAEVRREIEHLTPPLPMAALATGGTARAIGKVTGPRLGTVELERAVARLAKRSSREVSRRWRVDRSRARSLAAGAVILSEVQSLLEVPLDVARGGLREGAALTLVAREAAA
jgi:exopolyphosphatase/guanosine-5'-triphosphate,3'-diphosphate pyrophosphatase